MATTGPAGVLANPSFAAELLEKLEARVSSLEGMSIGDLIKKVEDRLADPQLVSDSLKPLNDRLAQLESSGGQPIADLLKPLSDRLDALEAAGNAEVVAEVATLKAKVVALEAELDKHGINLPSAT